MSLALSVLFIICLPSFIVSIQARNEYFRIEDDLRDFFPDDLINCNISNVEGKIIRSFVSNLIFTLLFVLYSLFLIVISYFGCDIYEERVGGERGEECGFKCTSFILNVFCFCFYSVFKPIFSLSSLGGLLKESECINDEEKFENFNKILRRMIITESIVVSVIFISTILSLTYACLYLR